MKKHATWFASAVAATISLSAGNLAQAQTTVLSDFQNFNLNATYANWDQTGSQIISGGTGYTPTITSGSTPGSFEVNAEGYGSGAYDFATPINASGANEFQFTFTINSLAGTGPFWMNVGLDISDGTHQVHLMAANTAGGYLNYGNFSPGTYTLYGSLADGLGGAPLDTSTITAFNLELDPAGYGSGSPYDITYTSLELVTVPEPSTFALVGMGMAGFLTFRRRKK
ncbi:MAG TPA: PEP-CTERM sorting domain-containing protein [Verrucomicrobiae bacterium]|nr:PEP-CTERM sorting domain-containing protein [Verrucomicrobiae bacterium]